MSETPTRRRVLRAVGVGAAVALAGCSSDDDSGGTTTDSGTTGDGTTTGRTDATNGTGTTGEPSDGTENGTTQAGDGTTETETETTTETEAGTTTDTPPPEDGGDVRFHTSSGAAVQGTLVGDGSCGIVLAHDAGFDRTDWKPQVERLADAGYTCLAIDLNLDDPSTAPGYVLAAVRYLRQRVGVGSVVLVGAGAGANAVVRANARADAGTIDGTMIVSPEGAVDAASDMHGWKLFVVSRGDEERFVRTTERMHENAGGRNRLERVRGDAHGQRVFETNRSGMWTLTNNLLKTVCG